MLQPKDPKYADWVKYLSTTDEASHRFNSQRPSVRKTADYMARQYSRAAALIIETVTDYASAEQCGQRLDSFAKRVLRMFPKLVSVAVPSHDHLELRKVESQLRERLLRRSEFWKAEAQKAARSRTEESMAQRAARRQAVLKTLLKRAGIRSDDEWAERAGESMDRNTPRDYRNGKTKELRKATREALAKPLGIPASRLPE